MPAPFPVRTTRLAPGRDYANAADGKAVHPFGVRKAVGAPAASPAQSGVNTRSTSAWSNGAVNLPGTSASGDMSVTKLVITPPNDYTQAEVTWNQSVVLQDGATHPGTYVTPVVLGS